MEQNEEMDSTNNEISFSCDSLAVEMVFDDPWNKIRLSINGGTEPYVYEWLDGGTDSAAHLFPYVTYYEVTVTDANGCMLTVDSDPLPCVIDMHYSFSCNGLTVEAGYGIPPYTYEWSNGETGSTIAAEPFDNHSVTVVDSRGCTDSKSIHLDPDDYCSPAMFDLEWNPETAELSLFDSECLSYLWSTGDTTSSITVVQSGFYSVVTTSVIGCTGYGELEITL